MTLIEWFFRFFESRLLKAEQDVSTEFPAFVPEETYTPWHLTMPAKFRPNVISSHTTYDEAVGAAMDAAADFAAAGWFVSRAHDRLWQLCGRVGDEVTLFTKLEVLTTDQLIVERVK